MEDQAVIEMPRYKCHKEVWALQIKHLLHNPDGTNSLVPVDSNYGPIRVDDDYIRTHKPRVDGYYVVYADGYKSYSPAKAFEEGYTRI